MANQRYYLICPKCESTQFMGKSLATGIYNTRCLSYGNKPTDAQIDKSYSDLLEEIYDWMWEHLGECLNGEDTTGIMFNIVGEDNKNV